MWYLNTCEVTHFPALKLKESRRYFCTWLRDLIITQTSLHFFSLRGKYSLSADCWETGGNSFLRFLLLQHREIYRATYDKRCGAVGKLISLFLIKQFKVPENLWFSVTGGSREARKKKTKPTLIQAKCSYLLSHTFFSLSVLAPVPTTLLVFLPPSIPALAYLITFWLRPFGAGPTLRQPRFSDRNPQSATPGPREW